jgi:hypothetical protein
MTGQHTGEFPEDDDLGLVEAADLTASEAA